MTNDLCPECDADLEYDEVDIGVGVQRGNYRCPDCGWAPTTEDCDDPTASMLPWPDDDDD